MTVECPIFGDKAYLFLSAEAAFGVQDVSPTYIYHPVINYAVEQLDEKRQPMPYTGMAQEFDTLVGSQHVEGPVSMPLYGWRNSGGATSLAEYMMTWAFPDLETICALASKTAEWAEGPDVANKKHLGLTVNNATLSGSDDGGSSIILALDLLGATEGTVTTAQTIPSGLSRLNEFLFRDSTFSIGPNSGALSAVEIKSFSWQVQRALTPSYNGSLTPRRFLPGKPNSTFEFNIDKADGTWDAIMRSAIANNYYGRLILKGLHNGTGATGNYAKVQIDFPKLAFVSKKDAWQRSGPVQQAVSFKVQKPTTSAASYSLTWSESAS